MTSRRRTKRWARQFFDDVVCSYDGDECLIWPFATVKGYGVLRVDGKLEYVCRLIVAGPPPSPRHLVAHECGRGAHGCVARRHLTWKTQKANVGDTLKHGTRNRGRRNGRSVLTEDDVRQIRQLLGGGLSRAEIGARFGVSREAVNEIAWGKNWGWLDASFKTQQET